MFTWFIHAPLVRHPVQMNVEIMLCEKVLWKILKWIKHEMFWFEYAILFILNTNQSPVIFLVHQNGKNAKIKNGHFWSKWQNMKMNVLPLFSKPNINFLCFFRWY